VLAIRDITPIPHNGCRPPKRRRVWTIVNRQLLIALFAKPVVNN
jgi:hypothetical protein